jgi:probable phosphomutase (TIGR03848 family)
MPLFLLIRHAENDFVKKRRLAGRQPGVHLNEKGRQQAQALAQTLAQKLADQPVRGIYCSPMERAIETAEPIAQALGLEVLPRPALIETDYGEWQGKSLRALARLKVWRTVLSRPSQMRFPGGESFAEAQHRIQREIEDLCAQHDAKDIILCVSHADPIKLAVAYYLGLPLDLFQRLTINTASITALHIGESGSQLLTLNYDLSFPLPMLSPSKPPAKEK